MASDDQNCPTTTTPTAATPAAFFGVHYFHPEAPSGYHHLTHGIVMSVLQGLWVYSYREDRLLVGLIEVRDDQIVERRDRNWEGHGRGRGEWGSGVKVGRKFDRWCIGVLCFLPSTGFCCWSLLGSGFLLEMLLKSVMLACYAGGNLFYTPSNVLERHTHHAQPFQTTASNYLFLFASFTIRGCL